MISLKIKSQSCFPTDEGYWIGSVWCGQHDEWHTIETGREYEERANVLNPPTHWIKITPPIKQEGYLKNKPMDNQTKKFLHLIGFPIEYLLDSIDNNYSPDNCQKPHCRCVEIAEINNNNNPVKEYKCLAKNINDEIIN